MDRPAALDAAVAAGLPSSAMPSQGERPKAPLLIGAAVAVVVLAAGIGVIMKVRAPADPTPSPIRSATPTPTPSPIPSPSAPTTAKPADVAVEPHVKMPSGSKLDGPLRVAVLKFKNVGNDKALGMLELGIGETAVNAMAAAGGGVALVERSDIESDIGEIDRGKDEHFDRSTVAQKGRLEGVQMAVQGGFQRAGKKVRITARFVRVENGEILDTLTVTRPARDLFGAQDEVARGLKQKLLALAALEKVK
jgi:TolB-like protein